MGLIKRKESTADGGKNWYKDKYEFVRQQRDVLSAITMIALLLAAGSVLTVMWITPYKSVEPFVIQIDEKSGVVQRVDPVQRSEFTANEAVDRYFVAQYIRAREGYVPGIFALNYRTVRVMSAPGVFNEYLRAVGRGNENSPLNVLGSAASRVVAFKNINFVKRSNNPNESKVALVRVRLNDQSEKPTLVNEYHRVVTVQFRYANLSLSEEERFMNPIGFLVEGYQTEQEVIQ